MNTGNEHHAKAREKFKGPKYNKASNFLRVIKFKFGLSLVYEVD